MVDEDKGHYQIKGDVDIVPTLYLKNGEEIDYGPVPELESIEEGKMETGGKRSPGGKRTRKVKRGKKKTRKTGNKKNKNKKRVSCVNKKRIGKKTRKNM